MYIYIPPHKKQPRKQELTSSEKAAKEADKAEIRKIAEGSELFSGRKIAWHKLGAWNYIRSCFSTNYNQTVRDLFQEYEAKQHNNIDMDMDKLLFSATANLEKATTKIIDGVVKKVKESTQDSQKMQEIGRSVALNLKHDSNPKLILTTLLKNENQYVQQVAIHAIHQFWLLNQTDIEKKNLIRQSALMLLDDDLISASKQWKELGIIKPKELKDLLELNKK